MALIVNHYSQNEFQVEAHSPSVGASPIVACARVPMKGRIIKVGCVTGGAITTSSAVITVSVTPLGGTNANLTGGTFSIALSGAAAGILSSGTITGAEASTGTVANGWVQEDDVIKFTPSNASGANIPATFFAVIKKAGG